MYIYIYIHIHIHNEATKHSLKSPFFGGQRRAWNIPEPTYYDLHDLGPVGWFLSSKLPAVVPISQLISRYLQILKVEIFLLQNFGMVI